ncbi:MAG: LysR family transcriptional regulator [Nannocystaceae bacterium]|nr:LysR family transcriptional regulator [Nannocystaceae bacterium]
MEFHQVRYFLAIAEGGSFTQAAKACGASQPALTTAIKKLEGEFEGELFTRGRGGAKITPLGEMMLPRMQRIAREHQAVDEVARNFRTLESASLRIGVLATVGPSRIAPMVHAFSSKAPGVELELTLRETSELLPMVAEGDLDLAVSSASASAALPPWAVSRRLYDERYVVLLPPEHPLLEASSLTLKDLHQQPYLDRLSCERRQDLLDACRTRGVELNPVFRSSMDAWVESLVDTGMGFSLLPEFSVGVRSDRCRPLVEPELARTVCAIRSADRAMTPAMSQFWSRLPGRGTRGDSVTSVGALS